MMATEATARTFFSAPYFAVVGASSDPNKFGHKSTVPLHAPQSSYLIFLALYTTCLRYSQFLPGTLTTPFQSHPSIRARPA